VYVQGTALPEQAYLVALKKCQRTRTGRAEQAAECGDHGRGIRVKTIEESAGISGFDAHKCVKGRKRHILVDTFGLLLSVYVTPADFHLQKTSMGTDLFIFERSFFVEQTTKKLLPCSRLREKRLFRSLY